MTIMFVGKLRFHMVYHVTTDRLYFSPNGKRLGSIVLSEHPQIKILYDGLSQLSKDDFYRTVASIGRYILKYGRIIK